MSDIATLLAENNLLLRRMVKPLRVEDVLPELSEDERRLALSAKLSTMSLGETFEAVAEIEGFDSVDDFVQYWLRRHEDKTQYKTIPEFAGVAT